ncbi:response regulator [Paenibacillus sp. V4I7]|uniref:response regulator n=1 Tax=Paenibacillus sp. V4I7 TaxID=3042307 RepID=UPI002788C0E6|nr:response regulator [Paenibacillus sp. V4I7]MDQ0900795.1 two-component system response regulator YesN [Paenibacillus sp. V4I7]
MLNAILADDEPIIIKGLRKLIPWQELGIQIIGEARTGKGLIELIEKESPDLVITDISMPDGTGIDVIKEVQKRRLHTKIIFISAYQEFSYAKDALAFGAVDYLVKPIEKNLLLEAVQKAAALLQEESEEQTFKGKLTVYEKKDKNTQLEELFDRLTEGDIRMEEAARKLQALDAHFPQECFTIMMLEIEQLQVLNSKWEEHEKRLLLFAISNLTDELLREYGLGLVIRKSDNLCAIVNHPAERGILPLAEEILDKVRYFLKISLTISVGETVSDINQIKSSYSSAVQALKSSFFTGGGKVIPRLSLPIAGHESERQLNEIRQSIMQDLLAKKREQLTLRMEELFTQVEALARGSKEAAVMSCYTVLMELTEELTGVGIGPSASKQEQQEWTLSMHAFNYFEELKAFITSKITDMLEQLHLAGGGKEAQQMKFVKEYMEQHYSENITLESIASMVYMNPYYFSSFFKKHTNENFKQYLTDIRLKQAVKLLLQTDLMVYEIAEQVGYNNARQFSDMFKKSYGKLPQEYKTRKE